MTDIAIRVENLGKQYRIGGAQAGPVHARGLRIEIRQRHLVTARRVPACEVGRHGALAATALGIHQHNGAHGCPRSWQLPLPGWILD